MRLVSLRWAPLICLTIVLLVACGGTPQTTITGQVRDAYTNQPIEGAQVTFGSSPGLPTDAQGRYKTQNWTPQDTAVIQAAGYETRTMQLAERQDLAKPGVTTATLDTTLRPNTLSGIVRDAFTQKPLAGALVAVSEAISVTADADGQYELDGVPEAFEVTVSAPEHETTKIDVRRTTEQNLDIQPTALVGMVTDFYSTKPVAGVHVSLGDAKATTGADGHFSLENIPPDGQLVFTHDGYNEVSMPLDRTATVDVVMRPSTIEGIVADAQSGTVLSDTVVIASLAPTGTVLTQVKTNASGQFRLEKMPEGVSLQITHPGYKPGTFQVTAGALKDGIKLEPLEPKAPDVTPTIAESATPTIMVPYTIVRGRSRIT